MSCLSQGKYIYNNLNRCLPKVTVFIVVFFLDFSSIQQQEQHFQGVILTVEPYMDTVLTKNDQGLEVPILSVLKLFVYWRLHSLNLSSFLINA